MKLLKTLTAILLVGACLPCAAKSVASTTYDEAHRLSNIQEYLSAAKLFSQAGALAENDGDYSLEVECLLAQGECFYALDLSNQIQDALNKASAIYSAHSAEFSSETDLLLQEGLAKLQGSHFYSILDTDSSAFAKAEHAYNTADSLINELETTTFHDDAELRQLLNRDMMNLYYKAKDYNRALELANEVCYYYSENGLLPNSQQDNERRLYRLYIDAFCARAMILARLHKFEEAMADIREISEHDKSPKLQRTIGKILMMQYDFDQTDNRAKAAQCYSNYIKYLKSEINNNLASMTESQRESYWLSVHDFLFDCYRLGDFAPEMLYDLALFAKGYLLEYANGKATQYSWRDVQSKLAKDACAIEFVQYNGKDDTKQIGALVIKKDSKKPQFIDIISVDSLEQHTLSNGVSLGNAMRNDIAAHKNLLYTDSATFAKIWTPKLIAAIGNANKVYFSPDGLLHLLAIEYMTPNDNAEYHRLSSTKVIINPPKYNLNSILICGGINYSQNSMPQSAGKNDEIAYTLLSNRTRYFSPLPGTSTEVDSIYAKLNSALYNYNPSLLKNTEASESSFCEQASNGVQIIHLSTHGFFTGEICSSDLKPAINDNSLSESGLIMAGANANLIDNNFNPANEDGILTAKELAEQDLSKVGLIVLSACQTALGKVSDDGVYGLQRGLKQAGVGAMMLSLWSVSDIATCELMQRFYDNLASDTSGNPDIYKAFTSARKDILNDGVIKQRKFSAATLSHKITTYNINEPQHANAFILIDII